MQYTPSIKREELPSRIKKFVDGLPLEQHIELVEILQSLAYFQAAESIRFVFKANSTESMIEELICMCAAPKLEDKEFF